MANKDNPPNSPPQQKDLSRSTGSKSSSGQSPVATSQRKSLSSAKRGTPSDNAADALIAAPALIAQSVNAQQGGQQEIGVAAVAEAGSQQAVGTAVAEAGSQQAAGTGSQPAAGVGTADSQQAAGAGGAAAGGGAGGSSGQQGSSSQSGQSAAFIAPSIAAEQAANATELGENAQSEVDENTPPTKGSTEEPPHPLINIINANAQAEDGESEADPYDLFRRECIVSVMNKRVDVADSITKSGTSYERIILNDKVTNLTGMLVNRGGRIREVKGNYKKRVDKEETLVLGVSYHEEVHGSAVQEAKMEMENIFGGTHLSIINGVLCRQAAWADSMIFGLFTENIGAKVEIAAFGIRSYVMFTGQSLSRTIIASKFIDDFTVRTDNVALANSSAASYLYTLTPPSTWNSV